MQRDPIALPTGIHLSGRRAMLATVTLVAIVFLPLGNANAQRSWEADVGDWNDPEKWAPIGNPPQYTVPNSGDVAVINNGGKATLAAPGTAAELRIGGFEAGTSGGLIIVPGGQLNVGVLSIGEGEGSSGSVLLSGNGSFMMTESVIVGRGMIELKQGGAATTSGVGIGFEPDATATVIVTGMDSEWMDYFGVFVGGGVGSSGTLNISNHGKFETTQGLTLGDRGPGSVSITSGGELKCMDASIGDGGGGFGTVTVDAAQWATANMFVGNGGSSHGRATIGPTGLVGTVGNAHIGLFDGNGVMTFDDDSAWAIAGDLFVGEYGTGKLEILGGSYVANRKSVIGLGTASLGTISVSGVDTHWNNSETVTVSKTGTLSLSNNALVTAIGGLSIEAQGKVTGDGIIRANVTSGGAIIPGGPFIDELSIQGNYIQNTTGSLQVELASASSYDKLKVTGNVTLGGALQVSLSSGFTPALNDTFDILDWGNVGGTFASLQLPQLAAGLSWSRSDLYSLGALKVVNGPPGDYNSDGQVDAGDFVVWKNGELGGQDAYNAWRANFGKNAPGSASGNMIDSPIAAVPEPAPLVFLVLGAMLRLATSRRWLRRGAVNQPPN